MNVHPRFVEDIDGDGMADIIGCGGLGVYIQFSNGKDTGGTPLDFGAIFLAHNQYANAVSAG